MTVDVETIKLAKQGDADSFAALYESIAADLYKVALYTIGNAHDAQDVVSETFLEAYKGIKNLRKEESFKPWMMRILSIRCKRKIAQYIKQKNVFDIESFVNLPSDTVDMQVYEIEKVELLNALQTLTPQERMVVILCVMQGYTTKEAAQIMAIPHGTVSSKLFRTLKKLRAMLEEGSETD